MNKVLFKSMFLFVAILFTGIAQAQTVTGKVTEENGPLPGANVIVKGTSNGATTDFDGNYSLNNVPSNATLVFSYVGFVSQEVAVDGRTSINVNLATDNALEEVVLIGYGTTTIKDATGSVASVTSEDFNQGIIQSPEELIQGKTAGVQISQSSGEPGSGISINIRGNNSIRSGNNPLFVVDGVPLAGGGAPANGVGGIGSASGGNPLSFLNPNDIESVSILKDASATAIYGSRGANGVIIIQTKGGRGASDGVWELSSSSSFSKAQNKYDLLNREEFLAAAPNPDDLGFDTDWQDFYTRETLSSQTNLSYSKSYNSGNLRASFGYGDTQGIVQDSDQERISGRLNMTQRFFDDKLTLTGNASISRVNRQLAPLDGTAGSTGDLIGASITLSPLFPIDEDTPLPGNVLNPANLLKNYLAETKSDRSLLNISANYDFTQEFSAKVTAGYDNTSSQTISAFNRDVLALTGISNIGRGAYNTLDQKNSLLETTLTYKKELGNVNFEILGGYSFQKFAREGRYAEGAGFDTSNLNTIHNQLENQFGRVARAIDGSFRTFGYGVDGNFYSRIFPTLETGLNIDQDFEKLIPAYTGGIFDNTDELQSYFMRAQVNVSDKYLFTGTFRADGSSTFGDEEQYGYFPSGAFAWRLDQEDFISENISTLKLRLAAGVVGSQEGLGYGLFVQREQPLGAGIGDDLRVLANGVPGTEIIGLNNPNLKWETTTDYNVGLDFGFNNDRFNGYFNIYRKETRDLLLNSELASPSNGGTVFRNLEDGIVINQGVELALNYVFIETSDFSFNANFNIGYNDNEVQETIYTIPTGIVRGNGLTDAFTQQLQAGQPLFSFFMAEFTGIDANGDPTYFDFDGNGVGDPDSDKFFIGENAIPSVTSGLSLNARYKDFDFSTYFNGQFGFSVYNATANAFFNKNALLTQKNITQEVANSNENISTVAVSSRFLEKGDFVRLQSASLGYNVPINEGGTVSSLRFSITGQNLFLITDYSGLDPEVSSNTGSLNASNIPTAGIDYAAYPRPRTITLGINARF